MGFISIRIIQNDEPSVSTKEGEYAAPPPILLKALRKRVNTLSTIIIDITDKDVIIAIVS